VGNGGIGSTSVREGDGQRCVASRGVAGDGAQHWMGSHVVRDGVREGKRQQRVHDARHHAMGESDEEILFRDEMGDVESKQTCWAAPRRLEKRRPDGAL
jgi:hypothetical protein